MIERLKNLRKSSGLSQTELADELDISRVSVSRYENENTFPALDILCSYAAYFDVSIDFILFGTASSTNEQNLIDHDTFIKWSIEAHKKYDSSKNDSDM